MLPHRAWEYQSTTPCLCLAQSFGGQVFAKVCASRSSNEPFSASMHSMTLSFQGLTGPNLKCVALAFGRVPRPPSPTTPELTVPTHPSKTHLILTTIFPRKQHATKTQCPGGHHPSKPMAINPGQCSLYHAIVASDGIDDGPLGCHR